MRTMKILIIEDNKDLALATKKSLEHYNYIVELAFCGEDGEEKAYANEYDAILLDLNLPDKDGLDILKFLREEKVNTPLIIITARDEITQRALGLDLGADDYIVKPFNIIELKSRIGAVIRRFNGRSNPLIQIENLTIDPYKREVSWNNQKIELLSKEFDILEYIAQKHPCIISKEEIAEHIYEEQDSFDQYSSVLRVHFTRLRKKLMTVIGYNIIVTIRGKGVLLCVDSETTKS